MKILRHLVRGLINFINALYRFFQYFLLPLLLFGLGAMVVGKLGMSFGITYLFWDQVPWRQLVVGLALGLGFAHIIFIGFVLDYGTWWAKKTHGGLASGDHWAETAFLDKAGKPRCAPGLKRQATLYLWYYFSFLFVTVLLAFVFDKNLESLVNENADLTTWPLIVGFFITAVIGVIALTYVGNRLASRFVSNEDDTMHFWAGIVFAIFLIVYGVSAFVPGLPASVPLIVLFSLIAGIYGFMSYFITTWKLDSPLPKVFGAQKMARPSLNSKKLKLNLAALIPPGGLILTVGIIVLLWIGGLQRYKYRFPQLKAAYSEPIQLDRPDPDPASGMSDLPRLNPSDIALTDARRKRPFVIVSTSGGGITAAAWTIAVLNRLEDADSGLGDFPYAVRAVTGASGGMVGAAYWIATLQPPGSGDYHDASPEVLYERISEDSLTPMAHQLIYNDAWQSLFSPFPIAKDRGQVLEASWNEATDDRLARTLGELYEGEKAGWLPSIVFSPMLVEDGRRLVVSNLNLSRAIENRAAGTDLPRSISAIQFSDLFPADISNLKLSTAARMNASFPYVSPAASLPTTPKRRVVDAGYYDNYGIDVAANWIMRSWDRDELRAQTSHVIVIEIDAFSRKALLDLNRPGEKSEATGVARALEGITSPPEGLLSAWGRPQSFRNDELITALRDYLHGPGEQPEIDFTSVRFTNEADVSLSWILTQKEKDFIEEAALPESLPELGLLREAWNAKSAP